MSDIHPKKKQKMNETVWGDEKESPPSDLTAGQLDRFSRQNAALGKFL